MNRCSRSSPSTRHGVGVVDPQRGSSSRSVVMVVSPNGCTAPGLPTAAAATAGCPADHDRRVGSGSAVGRRLLLLRVRTVLVRPGVP